MSMIFYGFSADMHAYTNIHKVHTVHVYAVQINNLA